LNDIKTWTCKQLLIYIHQILFKNLEGSSDFIVYLKNDITIEDKGTRQLIALMIFRIKEMQNLRDDIGYWLKNNYDLQEITIKKEVKGYKIFTSSYDIHFSRNNPTITWMCKEVIMRTRHLLIKDLSTSLGVIDYLLFDDDDLEFIEDKKPLLHFRSKIKVMEKLCHDIPAEHDL